MTTAHPHLPRPLLLHFASYIREMRSAPFPTDTAEATIEGPDPDRLLFIGDAAVAGYGVLHHGMAVPSRTAGLVSRDRGHGCHFTTQAAAVFTAARAARMARFDAAKADAVIIMLGALDLLLGTRPPHWAASLSRMAVHAHAECGADTLVIFTAIPPMGDTRAGPQRVRDLLTAQSERLNTATCQVASETSNAVFLPLPPVPHTEEICWRTTHETLAHALAPTMADQLSRNATRREPPSHSQ